MSTVIANIKLKARTAFDKIGHSNGTAKYDSSSNLAHLAHEYFIADLLASMAEKRKKMAKEAAEVAGLLVENAVPGSTVQTYSDEHLTITAKTNNPASRLDQTKLSSVLIKEIGATRAMQVIKECTVENKPATSYIFASRED